MGQNKAQLRQEIEKALESVRLALQTHGGDVELVDLDPDAQLVKVRLHGACVGCPMSSMTLKYSIESELTQRFPWIKSVEAVE